MGACELLDQTKPGRRRFLRLHLVDPHYRLCSTRNVPPQSHEWWREAAAEHIDWVARGLPPEIVCRVNSEIGEWPMGLTEAKRLRSQVLDEQRNIVARVLEDAVPYDFNERLWEGGIWREPGPI